MLTYEQMNESTVEEINKAFLSQDESHKWPIRGKFNATEKAIENLKQQVNDYGLEGMEYGLALDAEITALVNDEENW